MPGIPRSQRISLPLFFLLAFCFAAAVVASQSTQGDPWLRPDQAPAPAENLPNSARVELGQMLFFDPRLSRKANMSCASCHNPALGWSDGLPTAAGFDMQKLGRATPTIVNTAFNSIQMWDGRKSTLEDQALGPIEAGGEMNMPLPEMVARLKSIHGYRREVRERVSRAGHLRSHRGARHRELRAHRALHGVAVRSLAQGRRERGGRRGETRLRAVHRQGANAPSAIRVTTSPTTASTTSVSRGDAASYDVGRYAQKPLKSMRGAFKTPTLRDIALTAPYMRNGAYTTLMEVVEHYDRGGDDKENLEHQHRAAAPHRPAKRRSWSPSCESLDRAPRMEYTFRLLPR